MTAIAGLMGFRIAGQLRLGADIRRVAAWHLAYRHGWCGGLAGDPLSSCGSNNENIGTGEIDQDNRGEPQGGPAEGAGRSDAEDSLERRTLRQIQLSNDRRNPWLGRFMVDILLGSADCVRDWCRAGTSE